MSSESCKFFLYLGKMNDEIDIVDAKSFYNAIFLNFCHPINKSVWPVLELLTPWGGDEEILLGLVCHIFDPGLES